MSRVAVITGGSRGLGRSMALNLAKQGVDSVITYQKNATAAAEVVGAVEDMGQKALALPLDAGESACFANFADVLRQTLDETWRRSHFDFLVNNAGAGAYAAFAETSEQQFDELMRVHVKGPFFLTQTLLPLIENGGCILNISSGLTRFSFPGYAAYAVMKGAVEVMTRYQAVELGPRGIRVNTVAPGAIETDFGGGAVRDNRELNTTIATHTALGRAGLPDDIGGLVAMLLRDESGWINGQRIEASGGMLL